MKFHSNVYGCEYKRLKFNKIKNKKIILGKVEINLLFFKSLNFFNNFKFYL